MKKILFTIAVAITFTTGTILTGCQSSEQKEDAAEQKVEDAKEDLKDVQQDANTEAQKVATAEEWKAFRSDTEVKIQNNQKRIDDLRVQLNKPGKTLDPLYAKRIETLENENNELRMRMDNYEKSQSDWEKFKMEFNHDMDELGRSLKDFTVDNK